MAATPESPPILRPIPRRPFNLNLREPTPPEQSSAQPTPNRESMLNLDSLNSRLLDPRKQALHSDSASTTISRAQSVMNLTSSTLMGIYSPTTYGRDRYLPTGEELNTPWGTGAETPARGYEQDESLNELRKERSLHPARRRSSINPTPRRPSVSTPASVAYLGLRGLLLSGLGILYGLVVAKVQDTQKSASFHLDDHSATGLGVRHMAFWAVAGVALGSLLPWFDGIWERASAQEEAIESPIEPSMALSEPSKNPGPFTTDWALAIRGIGTFLGIVFAIRKCPWDSTLQVSLTLALVNPVLWFLIDRSITGLIVSAAVGFTGSAVLMGLRPDMVPVPTSPSMFDVYGQHNSNNGSSSNVDPLIFGGLARQETVAAGIWMLSVLFCCCVCFGNIGRWLAMNRSVTSKGRWAQRQ